MPHVWFNSVNPMQGNSTSFWCKTKTQCYIYIYAFSGACKRTDELPGDREPEPPLIQLAIFSIETMHGALPNATTLDLDTYIFQCSTLIVLNILPKTWHLRFANIKNQLEVSELHWEILHEDTISYQSIRHR